MIRCSILFLTFCLIAINAQKVRYDGYKVLRLSVTEISELDRAHQYAEAKNLDVWAVNAVEGWMDVMVPPGVDDIPFVYEVKFPDVQALINGSDSYVESTKRDNSQTPPWNFETFPSLATVRAYVAYIIQQNPTKTSSFVLNKKTYEGRDIEGIILGSGPKHIVIHCTIHAREWITTTTCLYIITQLVDPVNAQNLTDYTWHIIPVLNPDGYIHTQTDRMWRKNREPNAGATCTPINTRIGTDINRNFKFHWGEGGSSNVPCSETYRGLAAESTAECSAISSYLKTLSDEKKLALYYDIHAYGGMWMSPWGYTYTLPPPSAWNAMDTNMKRSVAAVYAINRSDYKFGSTANTIYIASGGSNDYGFGSLGLVNSYVVEAFGTSFTVPTSEIRPRGKEIWAGVSESASLV